MSANKLFLAFICLLYIIFAVIRIVRPEEIVETVAGFMINSILAMFVTLFVVFRFNINTSYLSFGRFLAVLIGVAIVAVTDVIFQLKYLN